jgi:tRNA dimethylallyltransferase
MTPVYKPKLVVILGPTCVGKTDVAIKLAERYGGEIISADSMQVYRYMDIGTAKPSSEEMLRAKHHLIDVVNPDEEFNAAIFAEEAGRIINGLCRENKNIFVAGGTGLYLKALLGGLLNAPGADGELREYYRNSFKGAEKSRLYEILKEKDEEAAAKIHPNDFVRIIRALEVWEHTGKSIASIQKEQGFNDRAYDYIEIGLNVERDILYDGINKRTDKMIASGLIEEVKRLMSMGYSESLKPMQSMSYRNVVDYIEGRCDMAEAVRLIKRDTRRYAKRQLTWFQKDADVRWFTPFEIDAISREIEGFFKMPRLEIA